MLPSKPKNTSNQSPQSQKKNTTKSLVSSSVEKNYNLSQYQLNPHLGACQGTPFFIFEIPCTGMTFPCTGMMFPCSRMMFPCTCVIFPCTAMTFPCTRMMFPRTCVTFPCTHMMFPCNWVTFPCTCVTFPCTRTPPTIIRVIRSKTSALSPSSRMKFRPTK